jgi:hypothetical protein
MMEHTQSDLMNNRIIYAGKMAVPSEEVFIYSICNLHSVKKNASMIPEIANNAIVLACNVVYIGKY